MNAPSGMTAELREELAAALDRFTIHSLWTFEFDDEPIVDVRMPRRRRRCRRAITHR